MKSVHNKPDFPPTTPPSTTDVTSTYPTDQNRLVPINPSPFTPNRDEAISLGDSPMLDSQSYFNSVANSGDPSLGKPNVPSIQCIESITSDTNCPSTCSMMGADKPYSGDAFVSRLPVLLPAFPSQRKVSHDLHQIASRVAPKLHRCDHCGHIFPSIQAYTRHKRACNKYECPICHRGFSQVGNMRRHTKIFHSDQKPFECKVCNKAYGIQQSFRYHMRDKHGIILGKSSKPDDK
uniref:C2H2-type domain-containing protein n=1 Tax=Ciona savignyi TaxID=51511 RepID=H2Y8V2_CIOSA